MSPFIALKFVFRQEILIHIMDNESYEKDAVFYVELAEPFRLEGSDTSDKSETLVLIVHILSILSILSIEY